MAVSLGKRLKPSGDGWVVPPSAAGEDFALIRLKRAFTALKPLQLWEGDREELTLQLKQAERHVTQAGYPEDHLDTLYRHENCQITGWAQRAVLPTVAIPCPATAARRRWPLPQYVNN